MEFLDEARVIWKEYVPSSGQSKCIQGEMLRSIEKLRDEAHRNGNINFNKNHHLVLISYLRKNLNNNDIFSEEIINKINSYLDLISVKSEPYLEDDIFDFICDRIVEWHIFHNRKPIIHMNNDKLPY